ncbi:vacuolar protein sorting protein [Reticulomyxa filosa]|uniref:Vacuolar protein sorting protein n=1 Tax=Reticulomyxa filosa TaxID=46433 RepID=X6NK11_RETFI|nr:vacuolar protein sorting protein [Reticulomyxa filosa]|eukprot:ETO26311.1 vacuolar protein sorting protein [Reticulomyxa filosa]
MHLAKINNLEEMELERQHEVVNPADNAKGANASGNAKGANASGNAKGANTSGNVSGIKSEKTLATDAFEKFLKQEKKTLEQCKEVIFDLIASHGRTQQLITFAEIQNEWTWVIRHYIGNGEMKEAIEQLSKLSDPSQHESLYYDFAPVLMHAYPKETIDMIIKINMLDPRKLIPALMRFESDEEFHRSLQNSSSLDVNEELLQHSYRQHNVMRPLHGDGNKGMDFDFDEKTVAGLKQSQKSDKKRNSDSVVADNRISLDLSDTSSNRDGGLIRVPATLSQEHTRQAIRYLESVVKSNSPQSKDSSIHNYLITLYCKQEDEQPLLRFIETQGTMK